MRGATPSTGGQDEASGALAGIRVLDLSRVLAGPYCGQLLADLGADVIKIERPGTGDDSRAWGPPYVTGPNGEGSRESAFYCACNRGKRSVTVDLAKPQGRALVQSLAAQSDVLIENFKVGTLDRQGLGYAALAESNSRLVYCSITGFGQTGPYRLKPGYDTIVQSIGGLMSVTGRPDDQPGGGPLRAGIAAADLMTGLFAALAIMAALRHRDRYGKGQHIDLSLLDVQVAALANIGMNYLTSGTVPRRNGNRLPTVYPSDAFRCQDGDIMLIVGNDGQFERFCKCLGMDAFVHDPRFAANPDRVKNADALGAAISAALRGATVAQWVERLEAAGIPCAPINDVAQVFADPQIEARAMQRTLSHPLLGAVPSISNPMHLSASPVRYDLAPPMLGEHTQEVLRDVLGMDAGAIAQLRSQGVL